MRLLTLAVVLAVSLNASASPRRTSTAPVLSQDGVELRWKWKKGETLVYKSSQETILEVGGQPVHQQMGYTYSMTATDLSDAGLATLQVKYLAVATKGAGPQGEFDYDSEKDKEPPAEGPAAMQARMVGLSFSMKMTPAGRVTDVEGYDRVLDAMMKGAPEDSPAARAQLKQMFNNETFKGMMQQMAPPLPEEKVAPGSTWANDFTVKMPMIGALKFSLKSRLKEIQDQNAVIEQDITVQLSGGDKDNPQAGLVEIKEGSGKASASYSIERGCFISQKSTMQMKMAIQGTEIPMKTVMELKLVPGK